MATVALASALCLAGTAEARIIVNEKTRYYDVSGKTGRDVYAQMMRRGPKIEGKLDHFIATTTLNFDYRNVRSGIVGRACVIQDVDIVLDVVFHMPRWKGAKSASPALRNAWTQFVDFTWKHERQHARIAREFSAEMLAGLKSVRGDLRKDCADMGAKLDAVASRIIARHSKRQADFDASSLGIGGQNFTYDEKLAATE